jgi:hypothetical protein
MLRTNTDPEQVKIIEAQIATAKQKIRDLRAQGEV